MQNSNGQTGILASQSGDAFPAGQGASDIAGDQPDLDRLAQDFRTFVADCEALLRNARSLSGQGASYARVELSRRMDVARDKLGDLRNVAGERAVQVRTSTEDYVRREPFKAVGIAAAAGALVALLMTRRS